MRDFLKNLGKKVTPGDKCFLFTCLWANGFNLLKINNFDEIFEIVKVLPNSLVVKNSAGEEKEFHEQSGTIVESTHATVCFQTIQQKEHGLTLLKVKFSDWNIRE
jgi:hypothetical protein